MFFGGAVLTIVHFMTVSRCPLRTGPDWPRVVDAHVALHTQGFGFCAVVQIIGVASASTPCFEPDAKWAFFKRAQGRLLLPSVLDSACALIPVSDA